MALRLKSRTQCPPGGFIYTQRETNWRNWIAEPPSQWDFNWLCRSLQAHRQANRRLGLNTNLTAIQNEVDELNARRVAGIPGGDIYLMEGGIPKAQAHHGSSRLSAAVGAVSKIASGMGTLGDWLGSGGPAVESKLANQRAAVCVGCPLNGRGDLTSYFVIPAAEFIRKQLEQRKDLNLSTPHDDKLGVCQACLCPMKLKVHVPLSFLREHLTAAIQADLDPRCWILNEKDTAASNTGLH